MERTVLLILYGMGLRIAELSTLKREDIADRWITVTGKGNKSRQLPLIEEVKNSIDKYLDYHPVGRYLFENGGVPMNPSQLRYIVTKVFKRHGIKATPHQLRHSFASHLLNNGARISDVSELLGHASMSTTQIYTKLGDAKKLKEYIMAHPLARDDR
jgi:integrase/recombinase XerC